jgi:hypothetical protein
LSVTLVLGFLVPCSSSTFFPMANWLLKLEVDMITSNVESIERTVRC